MGSDNHMVIEKNRIEHHIEPYIKENNLLQLSLFYFGKKRPLPKQTLVEWTDNIGRYSLICNCRYGVPGSFEQDVYTACMRIWVKRGMPPHSIRLNYSDIARELELFPIKAWVGKIKKSLSKLAQARYEFIQCFVKADENGNKKVSTHFSLFDSASLFEHQKGKSKRNSESELIFPDIIRENLEAKYYQLLDMAWYRALPDGLPRRLYEYLAKRRYHNVNGVFTISEEALCRWLPITDKHTTNRRKTLAKIAHFLIDAGFLADYSFDKSKKHCVFTYVKNATPRIQELIVEAKNTPAKDPVSHSGPASYTSMGELQWQFIEAINWIDTIPYLHLKRKKEIAKLPFDKVVQQYSEIRPKYEDMVKNGRKPKPLWVYKSFMQIAEQFAQQQSSEEKAKGSTSQLELFDNPGDVVEQREPNQEPNQETLSSLLKIVKLKRTSKKLEKFVQEYFQNKGYDYVKWNILYSNEKAKSNYSAYLQKALEENWAEEWSEAEAKKQQAVETKELELQKKIEQEQQEKQKVQELDTQKPVFLETVHRIDIKVKKNLWAKADKQISQDIPRRETNIKILFYKLVWEYLRKQGKDFSEALLDVLDFQFINEIAKDVS